MGRLVANSLHPFTLTQVPVKLSECFGIIVPEVPAEANCQYFRAAEKLSSGCQTSGNRQKWPCLGYAMS